jgi:hypothetical protein
MGQVLQLCCGDGESSKLHSAFGAGDGASVRHASLGVFVVVNGAGVARLQFCVLFPR